MKDNSVSGQLLLVDDEKEILELLGSRFESQGFKVFTAVRGTQALQILQNEKIDLVVSDFQMPKMSGLELLKEIRLQNQKAPLFILVSGFTQVTLEEAFQQGIQALFSKPFDFKQLLNCIRSLLKNQDPERPRLPRESVVQKIKMTFTSFENATEGHLFNISEGGFFVQLTTAEGLTAGDAVSFEFTFLTPAPLLIEGTGIVRWIRAQEESGLPLGCGIQFDQLNEESRRHILMAVNALRTGQYKPRY